MRHTWKTSSLCLALLTSACAPQPPGELVQSSKARLSAEAVPAEDVRAAARDVEDFGLALYRELRKESQDTLVLSPYSLAVVLSMTSAGARGQTAAEMAQALHLSLPQERLHPAHNALDAALASRGALAERPFRLTSLNSLFAQKGCAPEAAFLDTLAENYGAGMRLLDFAGAPEPSRQAINAWVQAETQGLIPDLLPERSVSRQTRFVLTNSVYFKATWLTPFDKQHTAPAPFHRLDGTTTQVDMMALPATRLRYAEHAGFRAVELPYDGGELTMLVVLPPEGDYARAEEALSSQLLGSLAAGLTPRSVEVRLPKLKRSTDIDAREPLRRLGMVTAFTGDADFSGLSRAMSLHIAGVYQKAFIAVDEEGTEAAAASGVVIDTESAGPEPEVRFHVDRPYFFVIRDDATGLPLFFGGVVTPA